MRRPLGCALVLAAFAAALAAPPVHAQSETTRLVTIAARSCPTYDAITANRATPFHHRDAFVRFRPYASSGSWGGSDPLAELARTPTQ